MKCMLNPISWSNLDNIQKDLETGCHCMLCQSSFSEQLRQSDTRRGQFGDSISP